LIVILANCAFLGMSSNAWNFSWQQKGVFLASYYSQFIFAAVFALEMLLKMVANGVDPGYASKFIQYGWETITEALKQGGITGMMNRLDNPSKIKAFELNFSC
jgi:hypothetical protein